MAEVVQRKCPNCAAALPAVGDAARVRCDYCDHEFDLKRTVAAPAVPPPAAYRPPAAPFPRAPGMPVAPRASRGCALSALIPLVILAVAGFSVFRMVGFNVPGLSGLGGLGGSGGKLTHYETIGLFAINGDAIEDPLFLARTVLQNDQFHVVAFDGATMSELWRTEPLGNFSQAHQYTHAAVVGNRVVVTDFRGRALLLDLASGAPVATAQLPDRAKALCGSPSGGTVLWVEVDNGQNATIDTATGFVQQAPQSPFGAGCPSPRDLSLPPAQTATATVQLPGFVPSEVLTDGTSTVAVGQRAAGIRVPMVVGLSPQGGAPQWQIVPLSVDEALYVEDSSHPTTFRLGAGRLLVSYSLQNDEGRLVALDARSGARLWESAVPKCCAHGVDIDELIVGPTRLVTEQFGQAEVWDAQTGTLLGRVSVW